MSNISILGSGGGNTPAMSNMTWYVATTGSDSNPGTITQPFRTIQHAINVAASYNYQNLYTATINVADGTYAVNGAPPTVTLLPLTDYPANQYPSLIGNAAARTNCIISNTAGDALATEWYVFWSVNGFQLKSTSGANCDLNCQNYSVVNINNIDFAGSGVLLSATAYSIVGAIGASLSSSTTAATNAIKSFAYSAVPTDGGTWTFNNNPAFSNYVLYASDYSIIGTGAYTNAGTVTGNRLFMFGYSNLEFEGARSTLPGNGTIVIDQPSIYAGDTNSVLGAYENTSSTLANTIVLSDGAGNVEGDYSLTTAGVWSFDNNMQVTSNSTFTTSFTLINSSAGGKPWGLLSTGGAVFNAGWFALIDFDGDAIPIAINDTILALANNVVLNWDSTTDPVANTPDTGLLRESAGVVKVTNGASGYGTLDAAGYKASGTAGISATITTAKVTPVTGANGSMTFVNGILTAQTQAT